MGGFGDLSVFWLLAFQQVAVIVFECLGFTAFLDTVCRVWVVQWFWEFFVSCRKREVCDVVDSGEGGFVQVGRFFCSRQWQVLGQNKDSAGGIFFCRRQGSGRVFWVVGRVCRVLSLEKFCIVGFCRLIRSDVEAFYILIFIMVFYFYFLKKVIVIFLLFEVISYYRRGYFEEFQFF